MHFGMKDCDCCDVVCYQLTNCDTEEVITTTSDLSAYSLEDVLSRDASEGGGCWQLDGTTACDDPETFTPTGDPYTGETACEDCLSDCHEICAVDINDMEVCASQEDGTCEVSYINSEEPQCIGSSGIETATYADGEWTASGTLPTCDGAPEWSSRLWVESGQWWTSLTVGGTTKTARVDENFSSGWAMSEFPSLGTDCCNPLGDATIGPLWTIPTCPGDP